MPQPLDEADEAGDVTFVEPEADPGATIPEDPSRIAVVLPIARPSRRQLSVAAAVIASAWLAIGFAEQVGAASDAAARAQELRDSNAAARREVAALEAELTTIQDPGYVALRARAYGLGDPKERRFTLAADAPPLGPDAPGSPAVRLGAPASPPRPLDAWLELLFGPPR